MNKFCAKVNFDQEKNAEHLIKAFFQNFDSSSSIVIRGKEAKMEIFFHEPPMEIIDAICHCKVIELNYGETLKESKESKTTQAETSNPESESSKKIKLPQKKRGRPSTKKLESTKEAKLDENVISKPRVKMECMPEIKAFEEILASVDKTQPVEKRIRYVLEAMELNNLPVNDQKAILEIANAAVKKSKMNLETILGDTNIPNDQKMTARMTFSKFINDFVQKYESSKKVKLLTFLSELQEVIMLENEIEEFSTCTY